MATRRSRREKYRSRNGWASVSFEDLGLQDTLEQLVELKGMKLRVGFLPPLSNKKYADGKKVAKIAAISEYGQGDRQPARPWMRPTVHAHRDAIEGVERTQIEQVILGAQTPLGALSAVGAYALGLLKAALEGGGFAALDPATVRLKGHATPLFDTGLLRRSMSWTVKKGAKLLARGQ